MKKTATLKEQRPFVALALRVKTKRIRLILLVFFLVSVLFTPCYAKKPVVQQKSLTAEQEAQFTYYWYAARQAIEEENYAQAYVLLEFCHMINPNDAQTIGSLGVIYGATNQYANEVLAYRNAFDLAPGDQWRRYSEALIKMHTPESRADALKVSERALAAQKSALKQHKRWQIDPDLLEQLRAMYADTKQWKKALAIQDEIDKTTGYDAYSAFYRYRIYARWGKTKKAISAIDKYLETNPTDIRFLMFRIELMQQTKAKKEAVYAMYERILEIEPYHLETLNDYAYLLATQGGDLNKAERMSAITIREEPNNATYLDTYGWILHLKGENELAEFYLHRALWNAPNESVRAAVAAHLKIVKGK